MTDALQNQYEEEARLRWGDAEAFKESQRRVTRMTKEELEEVAKRQQELTAKIAACMKSGFEPSSRDAQFLIAQHYDALNNFYSPTLEIYRGLAEMYISDERFKAYYEKFAEGLARYMHDTMMVFCELKK